MDYKKQIYLFAVLSIVWPVFTFATSRIDINAATLEQLDELSGIGPKYAQAIIDGRPYATVDGLLRVKGIGEKTLAKIKEQGLACVNCVQTAVETKKELNPSELIEINPNQRFPSFLPAIILAIASGGAALGLRLLTKKP